jgi:hypothetical protein
MSAGRLLRIVAIAMFVLALICAAAPTTILGVGWFVWTSCGLIVWAAEPVIIAATTP